MPSRASRGSIENNERSNWIGYSNRMSSSPWLQKNSLAGSSGGPVRCASASSYDANERSDWSDARTDATVGDGSLTSSS